MIAKRLFLDFAPSEWQSLVSQVSAWSHWTPAGEKRLAHDLTEEKLSAIIKKANGNVLISILVPATEVLAEYLPAMEEAACEQNTLDDMERRMKEEINLRLEIQAEMDKQKEKYEANMKKMMLLIDKLNAALKAKEEQYNSLESVRGWLMRNSRNMQKSCRCKKTR